MTGAHITSTLISSIQFHDKQFGLETMRVGGGQAWSWSSNVSTEKRRTEALIRGRPSFD
jgi:hypothetical protein